MEKRLKKLLSFYIIAFFLLAFGGAFLLQYINGEGFADNLQLSISAVCLRGGNFEYLLQTNILSHIIVLLLINGGAILWLFFALQFANIIGQAKIFHNFNAGENTILPARTVFGKALIYIILLEVFFAVIIYAFGKNQAPDNITFWAIFNGASVAVQSGFTYQLYSEAFKEAYIFHLVIGGLIIVSKLGYPVFYDLVNIRRLRQRMLHPEINWTLQTRISIYFTAALLVFGSLIFWITNTALLNELKLVARGITVFFNVSAWAGAGLYTVLPLGLLGSSLAAVLMLAGSGSGSFGLLSYGLYYNVFMKSKIRKVALSVLLFAFIVICISTLLLDFYRPIDFLQSLFYNISVFTGSALYVQAFLSPVIYMLLLMAGKIGIPAVLVWSYLKFCRDEQPSEVMII